jgi:hypothetical protein
VKGVWKVVASYAIHLVTWSLGAAAVVCGGVYEAALGPTWQAVLLTLGGTVLSAALIGTLLNAVWWHKWTKKALQALLQDTDLIDDLGLDRKKMRERLLRVLCAIYGSKGDEPRLQRLLRRDVLDRLAFPIRRQYCIMERLDPFPSSVYDLARLTVKISYALHYATAESTVNPPFPDNKVMTGFVDIPRALLDEWRRRLHAQQVQDEGSEKARLELQKLVVNEVPLFTFRDLSVNNVAVGQSEFEVAVVVDGTKPEPSIVFTVLYKGAPGKPMPGEEVSIRYAYTIVDNGFSFYFLTMKGLTDGLRAHLSFDPAEYDADLRYLVPTYWDRSERVISQSQEGEVDIEISAMLLAGHAILASWYSTAVRLSKKKSEPWAK